MLDMRALLGRLVCSRNATILRPAQRLNFYFAVSILAVSVYGCKEMIHSFRVVSWICFSYAGKKIHEMTRNEDTKQHEQMDDVIELTSQQLNCYVTHEPNRSNQLSQILVP
jgi:hypothetical protein